MLRAIVIFLSLPAIGKTEDYFPCNASSPHGIKFSEGIAGDWKRAVPQAFRSFIKKVKSMNLPEGLVEKTKLIEPRVEYSCLMEDGTHFGIGFIFDISELELYQQNIAEAVESALNTEWIKNEGFAKIALDEFVRVRIISQYQLNFVVKTTDFTRNYTSLKSIVQKPIKL
ncbi:unnamed protein product [Cylicocyclus nassatus]|uniref:Uncharacterized protein n=1 Tax=Cylicocyclus nassatus TaxID=53992 RepID=A0AA36DSC9_CYLNA|nr:unnamed protein product [Cylicocyclus nassatus]